MLMSYRRFRTEFLPRVLVREYTTIVQGLRVQFPSGIYNKKCTPLKMAVVWGTKFNFPDSLLIFVLSVVIISFRELGVTSVNVSDDRRCLRS